MNKVILIIMFLVIVFLSSLPVYAADIGVKDLEIMKLFTVTYKTGNTEDAAKEIEKKVNKWLIKNRNIKITQRCMSVNNRVDIVISIHYVIVE